MSNKAKGVKPSHRTYSLEQYRGLFSDERWEGIQKVVNHWVPCRLDNGVQVKMLANPETGQLAFCEDDYSIKEYGKNQYQLKVFEKILTPEELERAEWLCWETCSAAQEQRRFEKAKKIPESEWNGPVFDGDYYNSIEELRDYAESGIVEMPEYVYGSQEVKVLKEYDLSNCLYDIYERADLEDAPSIPKIPEYLQSAWNRFCEEYSWSYHMEDSGTVIILDK